MSVRSQSFDNTDVSWREAKASPGRGVLLRRTAVASTSLLALSAAMGWTNPALAAGTCGAPSSGVVDCTGTHYGSGIQYLLGDAVDDLTVNVGSFAGQTGAVTVSGGIAINSPPASYATVSETLNAGGNVTISSSGDGEIVQGLSQVYGYDASASSQVAVDNAAKIKTTGLYAAGISTLSTAYADTPYAGGEAKAIATSYVINSGQISTAAYGSEGISGLSYAVTGKISAPLYGEAGAESLVENSGSIVTSGGGATGIVAKTYSYGYGLVGGLAIGISEGENTGSISTSGNYATGISSTAISVSRSVIESESYAAAAGLNSGTIKTSGAGAAGMSLLAYGYATHSLYRSANYASTSIALAYGVNKGSIVTSGADSSGIVATAEAIAIGADSATSVATVYVSNSGTITTQSGSGISALALAYSGPSATDSANAVIQIVNSGTITAGGSGAIGIAANAEAISTSGASSSVTISNSGDVSATGAGGIGILAEGDTVKVTSTAGVISGGTGPGAVGISTDAVTASVTNGGTIESGNDAAVVMNGYTSNTLNNTGTITGFVTLHSAANTFTNSGTWNAVGGDSDFTHTTGGSSILVNTGTIVVVGTQSFTGLDTFTNAGVLNLTQAGSAGLGTRPAYETLTVSGDYVGNDATLDVDTDGTTTADVLKIDGKASGTTNVAATILGAPGQTTGNGILVAEANKTTSPDNFELIGNTKAHTEVAGAFEYNLDFVPGTGTSGGWYLQSKVFPGTYQFAQLGSESLVTAGVVNSSLFDLLSEAQSTVTKEASLDQQTVQVASTDNSFVPSSPVGNGLAGWGRFNYGTLTVDPSGSPAAAYDLHVDAGQFGVDYDWHNAENTFIVGGYLAPYVAHAEFKNFGGSEIRDSGTAYSAYGLWFSGPWRAGVKFNYDDTTATFTDTYLGTDAGSHPDEWGLQAAGSYTVPFDSFVFEPGAEFNYANVKGVSFVDGIGDLVHVGSTDYVSAKLYGRLSTTLSMDNGTVLEPYINAGLLYQGDSSTSVAIGSFAASTNINGFGGDIGAGFNTNVSDSLSLFAQGDYQGGDRVKGWTAFVGLRYTP